MKNILKRVLYHTPYIKKIIKDKSTLIKEKELLLKKNKILKNKILIYQNNIYNEIKNIENISKDINFKFNLFMDYYLDPKKALPATGALKIAQTEMIEIIKIFKKIMEKFNIPYWIDFGTLLGAKRHKGFIPWDNDIDVSVFDKDIRKMKKIFYKELPNDYEFINFWRGFVYRIKKKNDENGIFLDIYPYIVYGKDINGIKKIILKKGTPIPNKNWNSDKPLPINIILPLSETNFENIKLKAPNNIDLYLRLRYGNYHLLPKENHNSIEHTNINDNIDFYPKDKVFNKI